MYLFYLVDNCFTISCWFLSDISMNQSQVPSSHHGNFLSQFQDDAFTCWPWDAGYISFRDSVPCGSWALIFMVLTIQDREGLAWAVLTFQGVRLGASEQWLQSWLHASSILYIPLIERARRGGQINKQPLVARLRSAECYVCTLTYLTIRAPRGGMTKDIHLQWAPGRLRHDSRLLKGSAFINKHYWVYVFLTQELMSFCDPTPPL